jgi:lipopolysaccharide export system protein LptA
MLLAMLLAFAPDAGLLARPLEVSADKLDLLNREGRAIYSGHAKAIRDTTTVTCDSLTVFYGTGSKTREVARIEAVGHVEAVDGERHATGQSATYDNLTGILTVRGDPRAQLGTRTVAGQLVTFTTGLDRLEVQQARTLAPNESSAKGETVEIDADRLVLEGTQSTAVWKGNVRARRGTTLLKAPELTAHYDAKGTVTRVQARGGVEATDADKWARGQRADYDNAKGVLVVTGQPEARQGLNRMRGSRVTFVTGKDTVEVENAVTVLQQAEKKPRPP